MTRWKNTFLLTVSLGLTGLTNSFACNCVGEPTVAGSVKDADIVATGTVISKDLVTVIDSEQIKLFHPDSLQCKRFPYTMTISKYTVIVGQFYKGENSSDTIIIYTGVGGGDCGYNFKIGDKYIIYGQRNTYFGQVNNKYNFPSGQNIYWTDICSRTTLFNDKEVNEIKLVTRQK